MVKLVNGTWRTDFRTPSGKRIRVTIDASDKREAIKLENRMIAEYEEMEKTKQKGGITIGEAFQNALMRRDEWRSAKSPESIEKVHGYVLKEFGEDKPLAELDEDVLVAYGAKLIKSGLAASTVNKRLSLISVLFEEAIKAKKYHGKAPSVDRYRPKRGRMRLITVEEEGQALAILRGKGTEFTLAMADLIVVLADTGARLSEALAIIPSRVYRTDPAAVLLVDTKNGDNRVVPLTPRALEVLTRRNTHPMFAPLNQNSAEHIWSRVRKQMGLENDEEFVLHTFRHTFGSTLANAGYDAFRIQKLMGHKTIQTTEIYVKVAQTAVTGASAIMQSRYDQKSVQKSQKESTLGDLL